MWPLFSCSDAHMLGQENKGISAIEGFFFVRTQELQARAKLGHQKQNAKNSANVNFNYRLNETYDVVV